MILVLSNGRKRDERETGANCVDSAFVREATSMGVDVVLLIKEGNILSDEINAKVYFYKKSKYRVVSFLSKFFMLGIVTMREKPDLIRVNSFVSDLVCLFSVPKYFFQKTFFVQYHHLDNSKLRNLIARNILPFSKVVFCVSKRSKRDLLSIVRVENSVVVHLGVDRARLSNLAEVSIKSRTRKVDRRYRVIFVGHLESRKRPLDVLRVAKVLEHEPFDFSIVGNGPELTQLKAYAHAQCLTNVKFLTDVTDAELRRHYTNSDIFLFPSEHEGFGLVMLEALAAGLPVVAYDIEPFNEVINSSCGKLVQFGDIGELAESLKTFQNSENDWLLRQSCIARCKDFLWENKIKLQLQHLLSAEENGDRLPE